jgi:hypothetical protein
MTRRERPASFGNASAAATPTQGRPASVVSVKSLPAPRKRPLVLGAMALAYLIWLLGLVWIAVLAQRGN